MSPPAKEEYFEVLYKRYKEACRKEKTVIISECCAVCGYHRKHAIRLLRLSAIRPLYWRKFCQKPCESSSSRLRR